MTVLPAVEALKVLTEKFTLFVERSTVPALPCVQVPLPFKLLVTLTEVLFVYVPLQVILSKVSAVEPEIVFPAPAKVNIPRFALKEPFTKRFPFIV